MGPNIHRILQPKTSWIFVQKKITTWKLNQFLQKSQVQSREEFFELIRTHPVFVSARACGMLGLYGCSVRVRTSDLVDQCYPGGKMLIYYRLGRAETLGHTL